MNMVDREIITVEYTDNDIKSYLFKISNKLLKV